MNDYRIYQVTIGTNLSSKELKFKIIALEPDTAINTAIKMAKEQYPMCAKLCATDIKLIDQRIKN